MQTLGIVESESELWINYSVGINHKFNLARSRTPAYLVGFFPRMAIFICWLSKRIRFYVGKSDNQDVDVFVFAETLNQWTSLNSSVVGFDDLLIRYELLIDINLKHDVCDSFRSNTKFCTFGFVELVVGSLVMASRLKFLIIELRKKDSELIGRRLNSFLTIYFWIPFFFSALKRSKPKIILCSNDHNPSNRSLLAVAKYLKIPTAYVQHASVSSRFHKLDFDYSFLDGKSAYEAYVQCESNTHDSSAKNDTERCVFLSGVKRPLTIVPNKSADRGVVGIACKEADGIEEVIRLCEYMVQSGKQVSLRYHPATGQDAIDELNKFVEQSAGSIMLSSPYTSPVNEYLGSIDSLVASNSTILLEAAIVDVKSIYYEFRPAVTPDYYGYVEKGIAVQAYSIKEIVRLINGNLWCQSASRVKAIQHYSHTYNTVWHNREGCLVASHIKDILDGKDPQTLWSSLRF